MPDIRLQDYAAKIKDLIREDRQDEAIAHCQHILRQYPKFVEVYCLLGEACLDKSMYREAIEFFQRTLSADPENFIARVGLGIIYEEQGATPEAIWQMERAFELAPGNAEVRRELQRLYAQRDGAEKARLKLTRGALGRLYVRNGLYERAIGEFRSVLRQDPDLPEIRVALLEALWRDGRRLEAVESSLDLLEALPNCLKANLILGEIWTRGGHDEEGGQKLELANALDPENLVAQEMMGRDSPLPFQEVYIAELEELPAALGLAAEEAAPLPAAPVWAGDLEEVGAELGEEWETAEGEMPDWLLDMGITPEEGVPALAAGAEIEEAVEEPEEAEEIPEWLQELVEEEGPPPTAIEAAAVEGAAAAALVAAAAAKEASDEQIPDWLQELVGEEETAAAEEIVPVPVVVDEEMPDWLRGPEEPEEPEEIVAEEAAAAVAAAEEAPGEWVEGVPDEILMVEGIVAAEEIAAPEPAARPEGEEWVAEEVVAPEEEIPDSLWALVAAGLLDEADLESAMAEMPEEDLEAQRAEEVPDWLRDLMAEEEAEEALPEEPVVAEMEAEEVPDWLRDLGLAEAEEMAPLEEEGLPEEAVVAEVETEELPDWLRDLEMAETEEVAPPEEVPVIEGALPLVEETAIEEMVVEQVAGEEVEIEELPDWLRDLEMAAPEAEPMVEEAVAEEVAALGDEIPDSLRALVAAGLLDEADLESAVAEMPEEDLEAQRAEEVPDWLRDLMAEEEVPAVEAPVAEAPAGVEEALPEAAGVAEAEEALPVEPAVAEVEAEEVEKVPDWLRDLEAAEAEEMAPPAEEALPREVVLAVEAEPEAVAAPPAEIPAEEAPALEEVLAPVAEVHLKAEPEAVEAVPFPEAEMPLEEEAVVEPEVEEALVPSPVDELLEQLKAKPRDYQTRLELARLYRGEQEWSAALTQYEKLISARKLLPAVIEDLQPLVGEDVDRARVYQLLGDAYMQDGQLDQALEMYRQARQALVQR